jgi:dipeptidyl aminopeptidase/acylaminoacyl peptidase
MKKLIAVLYLAVASVAAGASVPMEDFFKDFVFDEFSISPDGTKVAALSMWKDNLNLYCIDLATKKPAMLTGLTTMGVMRVNWVGNNRLVFTGKEDGYPTGGIFAVDADGKNSRALSKNMQDPSNKSRDTRFMGRFGDSENEILVINNERRAEDYDVYVMNVHTGAKKMVAMNPGRVVDWLADVNGAVRVGMAQDKMEMYLVYRDKPKGEFSKIKTWSIREADIELLDFDENNQYIYVKTNLGHDTSTIVLMDPRTGEVVKTLFEDPTYDAGGVLLNWKHKLLGYSIDRERPTAVWVDEEMKRTQAMIDTELPDTHNSIRSRSRDGEWLIILAWSDRDPGTYYILNTKKLTLEKLVSRAPWINPKQMSECRPIVYTARDGLTIHGYLTLPFGVEPKNLPMIVNPHGGPWVRDSWQYTEEIQFLASRGYAVLQMNFRGSTGYGRKHLQAGYGQWGLKMQDDITDGVNWAVAQGYADPRRIAIYGASYGGYACMAGLAFTPDLYRCGINYVGVTDIALLLKTIPESWERMRGDLEDKTGNSKVDRERLDATSPLKNADKIRVPVMFVYGERDERVDLKHGTRMASSLKSRGIPVEWMSRVDEGHGYYRKENVYDLYNTMEKFLAKYMDKPTHEDVKIGESKVVEMPAKLPEK